MTERLRTTMSQPAPDGRPRFMPYVTGGYPTPDDTVPVLLALQEGGADVIELGVPFSDPLADGATVEHANHVAVAADVSYEDCLGFVREARGKGLTIPVVFMGYLNPLLSYGIGRAVADAASAGADGFIVVDMPPDEAGDMLSACRAHDLSLVPLVAPTSSDGRIRAAAGVADAFIYCVSVTGTTGERSALPSDLADFLARVRSVTGLPLAVGFGISKPEHAEAVGRLAEGVAVGSAIIRTLDTAPPGERAERVRDYVAEMSGRAHVPSTGRS
jgi:tryptophan synthase